MNSSRIKSTRTWGIAIVGAAALGLIVSSGVGCSKSDSKKSDSKKSASKTPDPGMNMGKDGKTPMDHNMKKQPADPGMNMGKDGKTPMDHNMKKQPAGSGMNMGKDGKTPTDHSMPMGHDMTKGGRVVAVEVGVKAFKPASIPAKPNEHLKLVFTRTDKDSCGTKLVISSTGVKYDLPLNKPVEVHLMAGKSGKLEFACGMNMLKGAIVVQN